jgi:hypothetical protein
LSGIRRGLFPRQKVLGLKLLQPEIGRAQPDFRIDLALTDVSRQRCILSAPSGPTDSLRALIPLTLLPSRPGEFHPEPLTDPDLNLSIHPARAIA